MSLEKDVERARQYNDKSNSADLQQHGYVEKEFWKQTGHNMNEKNTTSENPDF